MEKATLFYLKSPNIEISMEIYFTDRGQLYFDGYDIGRAVEGAWGDSDYEYTYTIEPDEVNKFYKIFNLKIGDNAGLLRALKDRFGTNEAYSLFGEFMRGNNISFESFTWA